MSSVVRSIQFSEKYTNSKKKKNTCKGNFSALLNNVMKKV